MENKIDNRYFSGLLELPLIQKQADFDTPSGDAISTENDRLNIYIAKYQKKLLVKLFGSEVIPASVETLLADESTLTSPIANYVFCNIIPIYQSQLTESGEKIHNTERSTSISYKNKQDEAWNDMVEMLGVIREQLYNEGLEETYPTDFNDEIYKLSYFI